jgi:hypothetical protein
MRESLQFAQIMQWQSITAWCGKVTHIQRSTLTVVNFIRIWYDLSEKNPVHGFGILPMPLVQSQGLVKTSAAHAGFPRFGAFFGLVALELLCLVLSYTHHPFLCFSYHHRRTHGDENRAHHSFA